MNEQTLRGRRVKLVKDMVGAEICLFFQGHSYVL